MNKIDKYTVKIKDFVDKEGMPIAKAGVKALYETHGGKTFDGIKDYYFDQRFEERLKSFSHEEEQLTDQEKKEFYENIEANNLNYLFELLDKARTSIFDIQANILSKIYLNLLKYNELSSFDIVLLMNINNISLNDVKILNSAINQLDDEDNSYVYYPKNYMETKTLQRFLMFGIFDLNNNAEKKENEESELLYIQNNDFAMYIKKILNDIL